MVCSLGSIIYPYLDQEGSSRMILWAPSAWVLSLFEDGRCILTSPINERLLFGRCHSSQFSERILGVAKALWATLLFLIIAWVIPGRQVHIRPHFFRSVQYGQYAEYV